MSTPEDSQDPPNNEFNKLAESDEKPKSNDSAARAIESLERGLQQEKDSRKEERFICMCIIISLVDAHFFIQMSSWTAPIIIGTIQILVMFVYARRSKIEEVELFINKCLSAYNAVNNKIKGNE